VSLRDLNFTYIGSTGNLLRRFQNHCSGFAAKQTAPNSLRPWGLLAYVTGFDGKQQAYKHFENCWIYAKQKLLQRTHGQVTIQAIIDLAKDIIKEFHDDEYASDLRLVDCGSISRAQDILKGIQPTTASVANA
jgi:predicted GIY-YIG superfamily endonuclease